MTKYIEKICGIVPYTLKKVEIELGGKNLIVTGVNGSGKTSFLRAAYDKTSLLIAQKKQGKLKRLKQDLSYFEKVLPVQKEVSCDYQLAQDSITSIKKEIDAIEQGLNVVIPNDLEFSNNYDERKAVIRFYEEKRLATIIEAKTAQGLQMEIDENKDIAVTKKVGDKLEQHLLNLKTRRSFAITEDNDKVLADTIDKWFTNFEKNLKILFEDNSIQLIFNSKNEKNKFLLQQKGKEPFTFQTLSAGYKAIFDIYADLLMQTEYFKVQPDDLQGTVFIDEIETHLHVSLQRLILPFFVESFPNIQFLVTTHSPFVLMSTPDTIVFDLEKEEPCVITEVKSQAEILDEYLGVPTTMPIWAEERLNNILTKYLKIDTNKISLDTMRDEMKSAGLAIYFPESVTKILEEKQ
ncbi:MAG: ATP-binding protein [Planctomycetaceae bacterium]|jgi:AAA15 family ATPase/GTPase|nr:ATP-binding protein [Planctomycetaceae bacterium]